MAAKPLLTGRFPGSQASARASQLARFGAGLRPFRPPAIAAQPDDHLLPGHPLHHNHAEPGQPRPDLTRPGDQSPRNSSDGGSGPKPQNGRNERAKRGWLIRQPRGASTGRPTPSAYGALRASPAMIIQISRRGIHAAWSPSRAPTQRAHRAQQSRIHPQIERSPLKATSPQPQPRNIARLLAGHRPPAPRRPSSKR